MSIDNNYEVRDVIHGFISFDEQEREIINHPVFQRLRRIKQLSLTSMVYPGANHTRFEHSIGVMQMATNIYHTIITNARDILKAELNLKDSGINKWLKTIRLAALLHDIGHAPFSHAGEENMPIMPGEDNHYDHEAYSISIIKNIFRELIEDHSINNNYGIKAEDVTALLGDNTVKVNASILLWKELISGQLDADRADYLLRDSLHTGVSYGMYDKNRLLNCMTVGKTETDALVLAIKEGGWHIAESLVIARYQMFLQVYFHKTRRIYDYHLSQATKCILTGYALKTPCYPTPECLDDYIKYDDWKMLNSVKEGEGGVHGEIILKRTHYKCIYETEIIPTPQDIEKIQDLEKLNYNKKYYIDNASTKWYKPDKDIWITGEKNIRLQPLSQKSSIIKSMVESPKIQRFYIER